MHEISSLSDAELDRAIESEVFGSTYKRYANGGGQWTRPDGKVLRRTEPYSRHDSLALAAFDEAAAKVGSDMKSWSRTRAGDHASISVGGDWWGACCSTRPRALCECALAASRAKAQQNQERE